MREKELWQSVISQAFKDAEYEPNPSESAEDIMERAWDRFFAWQWLLRDDEDFPFVCSLAGLEPERVRALAETRFARTKLSLIAGPSNPANLNEPHALAA